MAHNVFYNDTQSDRMTGNKQILQNQTPQGARECSICFNAMTSEDGRIPRLLTCGHTFCTECIKNIFAVSDYASMYRRRAEREILCPHCKAPCMIPNGDVTKLPKNFILLEIISELPSLPRIRMNPETIKCDIHNIVKKSYCFNCRELVCPYCQMNNHRDHNCEMTVEAIKAFLPDFKQHQERLEAFSQQLSSAKDRLETTIYRLRENHKEASHHINLRFIAIIDEATKWKNINVRKLEDILKEREDILDQQIHSIDAVIQETKGKLELAQYITSPQNEEQFFVHYQEIGNDTKDITNRELGLYPLVHDHIEWKVDPIKHIIDNMNTIAFVNEEQGAGLAIDPTADPATTQSRPVHSNTSLDQPISVSVTPEGIVDTTRAKREETHLPARSVLRSTYPVHNPARFPSSVHSTESSSLPHPYAVSRVTTTIPHGHTGIPSPIKSSTPGNVYYTT